MAEYLIKDTTLVNIADAVRTKTGKTDAILVSDIASKILNIPTGVELNFEVVGGTTEPVNPVENTIWINTDTEITNWFFSPSNPYVAYKDVELMDDLSLGNGYITDAGAISSQSSSNPELYTEDYIPVKYGTTYNYEYTISETKKMWLAIVEYTGSYTFKVRNIVVNSVSNTRQTGTYTPSSSEVTAVRLTWRTFPNTTHTISFIECDVEYTVGEVNEGAVWISTEHNLPTKFNALKENGIHVCPSSARQYINGSWVKVGTYIYINGEQIPFDNKVYLYNNGNTYDDLTGGWVTDAWNNKGGAKSSPKLYVSSGSAASPAVVGTAEKINFTGFNVLHYTSPSGQNGKPYGGYLRLCTEQYYNSQVASAHITDAGDGTLDISAIDGEYYVCLYALGGGHGEGRSDISILYME